MSSDRHTSGKIDFLSIAGTIKDLCLSRSSGELQLSRGSTEKRVFFKSGAIIFATSNLDDDRLGDILLKHKIISRTQFDDAFRQVSSTGKKQGIVLVQMGILTPKELFQGLNLQVRSIILSLFSWEAGQYRFIDRLPPQKEIVTLHIQPAPLILEGVVTRAAKMAPFRDHWDLNTLKIGLHPDPPWVAEDLRLPQDARAILALVEKGTHWKKIPPLTGLSEENISAFLYTLAALDLISAAPITPEARGPGTATGGGAPGDTGPEEDRGTQRKTGQAQSLSGSPAPAGGWKRRNQGLLPLHGQGVPSRPVLRHGV